MVVYWDKEAREQLKDIYKFYKEIAGVRIAERDKKFRPKTWSFS